MASFASGGDARSTASEALADSPRQSEPLPPAWVHDAPLIGRADELGAFDAVLGEARAGRGRLIFLTGEPGIGKTRLAMEFARAAQCRSVRVLWGRCWEGGGAEEYWPWKHALRRYVHCVPEAALAAPLAAAGPWMARLVPELRPRLQPPPEAAAAVIPDIEGARFALFEAVAVFLRAAASEPLLIVLDDLHAADMPSLMLLRFLGRELRDVGVVVVGTYRDGQARATPEVGEALADLAREARRFGLRGFTAEEVGAFLRGLTRLAVSPATAGEIHAATEGNPFFVDEIVRLMLAEGKIGDLRQGRPLPLAIPDSVRGAIRERLSRLSPVTVEVLRLAAVLGRELDWRTLLAAWSPRDAAAGRSAPLAEVLERAVISDVLVRHGERGQRLAFRHGLIRDTLYDDLGTRQRTRLHRQIAAALERRLSEGGEVVYAELAHHLGAGAEDNEDRRRAVRFFLLAAQQAVRRLAFETARGHCEEALRLLDALPLEHVLRCEALLALADVLARLGEQEASRAACLRVAETARARGLPDHFARAAVGFGWHFDATATDGPRVALLEEALERLPENEANVRARLQARLGMCLYASPAAEERRRQLSDEAVALARRGGEAATLAFVLNARLYTLWRPAHAGTRLAEARELLRLAEAAGDRELALQSRHWIVASLLELGERAAAEREMALHRQGAGERHQPLYAWFAGMWEVLRALLDGRLDQVEALAQAAYEQAERTEAENAASAHAAQLFSLRWLQGRLGEMAAPVRALTMDSPFAERWRRALVMICCEAGDLETARREFEVACPADAAEIRNHLSMQTDVCVLAEACQRLGDERRAALLYDLLRPHADRLIVLGMGVATFGSTSRYLGLLAAVRRRWEEAETHLATALAMHRRLGARPFVAMTLYDTAALCRARGGAGDAARAAAALEEALSIAHQIGMAGIERRVRELL